MNANPLPPLGVGVFRWAAGVQGEEQEDAGGDGSCLPGHPEHVTSSS